MAGADYESVLCVKNEVFVYKIPPRSSNRGFRAAEWKLDVPDWTGRLRVISKGKDLFIKLEDKNSGELFAQCPVEEYPGIAVEQVLDSSRYFVLRIMDDSGRSAFIGIGFTDRADSFDLNVALQEHFKWLKQEKEAKEAQTQLQEGPKLDLGFKEGQTIKLNIGNVKTEGKSKVKPRPGTGGTVGLLPPPPGGVARISPPPTSSAASVPIPSPASSLTANSNASANSNLDLLGDLDFGSSPSHPTPVHLGPTQTQTNADLWGDFTSAGSSVTNAAPNGGSWVQF